MAALGVAVALGHLPVMLRCGCEIKVRWSAWSVV